MTTVTGVVIPSDIDEQPFKVEFESGDYKEIQKYVGGHFDVLDTDYLTSVWVNDDGIIENLEMNLRATLYVWLNSKSLRGVQPYFGDILLTGRDPRTNDTATVPNDLLELLFNTKVYKPEFQTEGRPKWVGNAKTFSSYWEAAYYVLQKAGKWRIVTDMRVVSA